MSQVAICCSAKCATEHVGRSGGEPPERYEMFSKSSTGFSCLNHLTGNSWTGTVGLWKASCPYQFE